MTTTGAALLGHTAPAAMDTATATVTGRLLGATTTTTAPGTGHLHADQSTTILLLLGVATMTPIAGTSPRLLIPTLTVGHMTVPQGTIRLPATEDIPQGTAILVTTTVAATSTWTLPYSAGTRLTIFRCNEPWRLNLPDSRVCIPTAGKAHLTPVTIPHFLL